MGQIKIGTLKNPPSGVESTSGGGTPLYVVGEILDTELYKDITSVSNWVSMYRFFGKDYKWMRARLIEMGNVDDTTWNTFSESDKKILCQYKATNDFYNRARTVLTDEEMNQYMGDFDINSINCRKIRYGYAKTLLLNNVSQLDAFLINNILKSDGLESDYINNGLEGIDEGDPLEGLFSFIEGRTVESYGGPTTDAFGNPLGKYGTTGVASRSLTMLTNSPYTQSTLVTSIMQCLRNGNY